MSAAVRAAAVAGDATLHRRLGPLDGAAIVVSNVIGAGIFYVPILVAQSVPSAWALLGVWLFGGALAFTGAMAYAELATLRPRAGGEYVYLHDAYGRLAAFLTGWTSFVAGFSGSIAASAVALAGYLGRFVTWADDRTELVALPGWLPLSVTPQALVAIVVILMLSLMHVHASGRTMHNVLAGVKVTALLLFIGIGLSFGNGSFDQLSVTHAVAAPSTGWLLALVPVMFAYSGWNAAAYVAEEIRNPSRNVPLALGLGTLAVIAIYLVLNVLYVYALPMADLAALEGQGRLTDVVAERLFGFVAGDVLGLFTIISIAASISAMVWAGPRVYFAMARDRVFLRSASRVHPVQRTPVLAIAAQAVWASVLVLSGSLSELVAYTGFAVVFFSAFAVMALFVLRRREPRAIRPFRALGYPFAPAFFIVASLTAVAYEVWNTPGPSLAGIAVIAAGVPVYLIFARRPATSSS